MARYFKWLIINVIPAQAGIQHSLKKLDSRLRGNDISVIIRNVLICVAFIALVLSPLEAVSAPTVLHVDWASSLKTGKVASKKHLNFSTPEVSGQKVFIGNDGGYFYSIDTLKGKKVWSTKLKGSVVSQARADGETIYVGDGKGFLYSISATSGEISWSAYIGEEIMARPAVKDGLVFAATQNNTLVAVDKSSGAIQWRATRPQPFTSMTLKGASDPVVIGDRVYVGNSDGVLVAYSAANGDKLATIPLATGRGRFTDIDTAPLSIDNKIVASTMEGELYSLGMDGKEAWTAPIASPNNILYNEGHLYVTSRGIVYCLNFATGETVWENDLKVTALSAPSANSKYVAVISTSDKLYLLDKTTGATIAERYLGGGSFGSTVVQDDQLMVLTNSGQLYAFKLGS